MRVACREMRVAGRKMWVSGRKMRVAICEMRVAIAKCRGIGEFYGISMAYVCNSFVLSGIDFIFGMVLV